MRTTVLLLSLAAAAIAAEPLTPEQTLNRRAIGDLEFSPDGSRLVFTVTEPVKGTARARAIWLLDVGDGRLRQLTFSGKSDGSPVTVGPPSSAPPPSAPGGGEGG